MKSTQTQTSQMPLERNSYIFIGIGILVIIIGFLLMLGEGNHDPNEFNENIYSFRRITVAPMVTLAGFIFEIWAILRKGKKTAKP